MVSRIHLFKRYRMERSLFESLPAVALPAGFRLVPWNDRLIDDHAQILHRCFSNDCDGAVFFCLRSVEGCGTLMRAMRNHVGFCPSATWLVAGPTGYAGTVQGMLADHRFGAIQNVGIVPEYRGLGLGGALLSAALLGFQREHATRSYLEVTASNIPAVRLYRKFGFRNYRLLYKSTGRAEARV